MDSLIETLKNMGPARLAMMLLTFFGLIIFFIFIAGRSGTPSMTLLYGDLSMGDATEIAAKLDTAKIAYRLSDDGKQISVGYRDVGRSRMLLAQEGLPRQGSIGYEIFDQKQKFGTTSFEQNINQLRALEGELARTIGTIAQVRSARVHLVLPQRELFSRDTQPASASVFLNLRNAAGLGSEQIQSIQHLVAASVPQLKATRVAIIDQNGNLLARGEEDEGTTASARTAEEMRQKYETRLSRSIEDIVSRVVGYGKVRASVSASLDFDVTSRNSEIFDPEQQVVRSTQTITDESSEAAGGSDAVTVQNNLPGLPGGGEAGAGGSRSSRTEEVTNFEIGKTIENVVRSGGDVKRLSIAVLVDGSYNPDAAAVKPEGAPEDWTPPTVYAPRTQEELDKIVALVKSAVGYDESRGDTIEVVNMPFASSDFTGSLPAEKLIMGFERGDILAMAETLALSVVAVLIVLLVLRPLATHFTKTAAASAAARTAAEEQSLLPGQPGGAQAQLAGPEGGMESELETMIDMSSVEGKVKASSMQKMSELVTNHPNETVAVIRQWMSQENV